MFFLSGDNVSQFIFSLNACTHKWYEFVQCSLYAADSNRCSLSEKLWLAGCYMAVSKKNLNTCMKFVIILHDYISEMHLCPVLLSLWSMLLQLISALCLSTCVRCEEEEDIVGMYITPYNNIYKLASKCINFKRLIVCFLPLCYMRLHTWALHLNILSYLTHCIC